MSLLRSSIPRSLTRQVQLSASTSQIRHNSSTRDGPDAKHLTPSRAAGSRDVAQEQKDRETNPLQASLISDAPREYNPGIQLNRTIEGREGDRIIPETEEGTQRKERKQGLPSCLLSVMQRRLGDEGK